MPETRINCGPRTLLRCALTSAALALAGCAEDMPGALEKARAFRAKGDLAAAEITLRSALAKHTKDPAGLFHAGQLMAQMGDLLFAELCLTRALDFGYPPLEVLPVLGQLLLDMGKYPEAASLLSRNLKPDPPTAARIAVLLGRARLGMGAIGEARTQFQLSQSVQPNAAAKLGLAQAAVMENGLQAAETLIAEVLAADARSVDALLLRADLLRASGKLAPAAESLREALALEPQNTAAIFSLAVLELTADRIEAARPLLERGEKLAPRSPQTRFAKALLAYKEKRHEQAIAELQELAKIIPQHYPGLLLAGMVHYASGKHDAAQKAFTAYLARFPADPTARRMLGASFVAKGQHLQAIGALEPVTASTRDVGVLAIAAEAHRRAGRFADARALLRRAIAIQTKNPTLLINLAQTEIAAGQTAQAVAALESALALGPADARADETLIGLLLGQKQFDKAAKAAAALEKRLPQLASTFVLKGVVQVARKDHAEARASLQRALQLDPRNLAALELLADVDRAENKPDARRERFEAVLQKDAKHLPALLALARLELAQGKPADAMAVARRALAAQPQSIDALLLLVDAQLRQGQFLEAETSVREAAKLSLDDARVLSILADVQLARLDQQGVIATLARLAALQPDVVSWHLRLAAAHLAVEDTHSARRTVLEVLERQPKDLVARELLADIYLQTRQWTEAAALAGQVQKDAPRAALGHRIDGDVALARGNFARALESFKKAAALQPGGALIVRQHQAQSAGGRPAGDSALRAWVARHPEDLRTRLYLADTMSSTGQFGEAAVIYREVLKRAPHSLHALNNLAWALHSAGDAGALQYARQAVQSYPGSAAAVDTLGWILVNQGNAVEGVTLLVKAVSLDPAKPQIRFHLAQALAKIGDTRRAKAELRTLLTTGKPFAQLAEARALAERLGP